MAEDLWKKAKHDLCIKDGETPCDWIVWEHSARVARLAQMISSLPELIDRNVNGPALETAALYHDAGWVFQVRSGVLAAHEVFLRPASDLLREAASDWITQRLKGTISQGTLEMASQIIRQCYNPQTSLIEAHILYEADNLDDIGPQAVALMIRKIRAEGKTLDRLVESWQRQEEYNYWPARIKKCFHYPSVRKLAEQRLESLRRFMADLKSSLEHNDLPTPAPSTGV